jgi:hypothetical protein
MTAPASGASGSGTSAVAAATKLRDEALAAAKVLKDEAAALAPSDAARNQALLEEAAILKSATAAQESVRSAAAALEAEHAKVDALEQQAAAIRARLRPPPDDDSLIGDDHSVCDEAAAVARLHSQAVAVQNIRNLIPIVLDQQSSNYKWCGYVLLILGRFSLKDHVLSNDVRLLDPAWSRMDDVVVLWIFNTISPDLLDVIHERDGITARAAWLGLEHQFLNNRESRAMLLDAEFRNLSQGALSVDEYCRKMKGMADALADLSEPIQDRTLVLNVLRGLNERFQFMAQLVTRQRPFPSFADVRADLRLAELNMPSPMTPPTALVATTAGKAPASSSQAPPRPPQAAAGGTSGSGGNSRGRRRRGGRGHGYQPSGPPAVAAGAAGAPWPSLYHPWTGPSPCGPAPLQKVLAALHRALVHLPRRIKLCWLACHQVSTH